jgi:hypothetical protein
MACDEFSHIAIGQGMLDDFMTTMFMSAVTVLDPG